MGFCFSELFDSYLPYDFIYLLIPPPISDLEAPRYGVKNIRIDEETTFSMRVSWQPVDSRNVRHYRLTYISAKGDRAEETVRRKKTNNVAFDILSSGF